MSGVFGVIDTRQRDGVTGLIAAMGAVLRHRDWYIVETGVDPVLLTEYAVILSVVALPLT